MEEFLQYHNLAGVSSYSVWWVPWFPFYIIFGDVGISKGKVGGFGGDDSVFPAFSAQLRDDDTRIPDRQDLRAFAGSASSDEHGGMLFQSVSDWGKSDRGCADPVCGLSGVDGVTWPGDLSGVPEGGGGMRGQGYAIRAKDVFF